MSEINFFFLKPEKSPIFLKENYYMKYAKLHFFDSFQVKKNSIHKGSSKTVFKFTIYKGAPLNSSR